MSNVKIEATDCGLEVDVVLGANVRKTHEVPGGESVELTVGGGQVLTVRAASNVAPEASAEVSADVAEAVVTEEQAAATLASCEDSPVQGDLFDGGVFPVADPADRPS